VVFPGLVLAVLLPSYQPVGLITYSVISQGHNRGVTWKPISTSSGTMSVALTSSWAPKGRRWVHEANSTLIIAAGTLKVRTK